MTKYGSSNTQISQKFEEKLKEMNSGKFSGAGWLWHNANLSSQGDQHFNKS